MEFAKIKQIHETWGGYDGDWSGWIDSSWTED
jgi:hypothetical protein